jgi:hypothetical protein
METGGVSPHTCVWIWFELVVGLEAEMEEKVLALDPISDDEFGLDRIDVRGGEDDDEGDGKGDSRDGDNAFRDVDLLLP